MAALAFDPLEYTHELEATGVSREQAEVHAKAMTATFLHNFEALVTRDYLDTRFSEFETRVESNMDKRFSQMESKMDKRFVMVDERFTRMEASVDKRFTGLEASMDKRFAGSEASMDKRFAGSEASMDKRFSDFRLEMHGEFAAVRGETAQLSTQLHLKISDIQGTLKLHSWIGGLLVAGMLLPIVERLAAWL